MNQAPLIAHVIHRLAIGGLENGLVNLINNLPENEFRHAIICTDNYTDFRSRIKRTDVQVYAMHKKPGQDIGMYFKMWKLFRDIKPRIVHTRNIGTLECQIAAFFAGVPVRIHGEHGRDMTDIDGTNLKYIFLRKILRIFVHQYIAMSRDLEEWLLKTIQVKKNKVVQLYNGVDVTRFHPSENDKQPLLASWKSYDDCIVLGTVGRLQGEKDQLTLINAFVRLIEQNPELSKKLRLAIIGEGPLRAQLEAKIDEANISKIVWLAGSRDDLPILFRGMDIFILPSLGEGISNTILEAMASGLPVIATNVGGNPELVVENETGLLVSPGDVVGLSSAIKCYLDDPEMLQKHSIAGRDRATKTFSLTKMIDSYLTIYKKYQCA